MRKLLKGSLFAFLLIGCSPSIKREAPSSLPPPPPPPIGSEIPCDPTPRIHNPDGSMSKAQAERNLGQGDVDLADCEAKRRMLYDAWPKGI